MGARSKTSSTEPLSTNRRLVELEAVESIRQAQPGWERGQRCKRGTLQVAYDTFNKRLPGMYTYFGFVEFTESTGIREKFCSKTKTARLSPASPEAPTPSGQQQEIDVPASTTYIPIDGGKIPGLLDGISKKLDTLIDLLSSSQKANAA